MANSDKNILITPNIGAATATYPSIVFTGANNTPITLRVLDPGTLSFQGTAGELFAIADGLTGTLFGVNDISGIPLMTISSAGNVIMNTVAGFTGIGPRTPEVRLHVSTNGPTAEVAYFDRFLTDTLPAIVRIRKARGTAASPTIVASGDEVGRVIFTGYDGSIFRPASFISSAIDNTPGESDMPGRMTFHTTPDGSASPLERMRITSSGDVGIGSSPSEALTVLRSTGEAVIGIRNTGTASSWLTLSPGSSGSAYIHNISASAPTIFTTNSIERMRIDNIGNVNIGSPAPQSSFVRTNESLMISTDTGSGTQLVLRKSNDGTNQTNINFLKSRGTSTSPTIVQSGDGLFGISASGYDGTSYINAVSIQGSVSGSPGGSQVPGTLTFSTNSGSGGSLSERMRIDSNQNTKFYSSLYETVTVSATAASATTINYDIITNKNVLYYTVNSTGNWTLNVRGSASVSLNTMLEVGQAITVVFLVTNGSPAYYPTVFQIDGSTSGITLEWQGGFAPASGNANSIDAYRYTIIKTAATPTYTVLASQTRFA